MNLYSYPTSTLHLSADSLRVRSKTGTLTDFDIELFVVGVSEKVYDQEWRSFLGLLDTVDSLGPPKRMGVTIEIWGIVTNSFNE